MSYLTKMLIDGKWLDSTSGKTAISYDPSTGDELSVAPDGDEHDVDRAVRAARQALESRAWRLQTPQARSLLLWRLADLIERDAEELAKLEAQDTGKPINEARYFDIPFTVDILRYFAGWPTKLNGDVIPISFPVTAERRFHAYTRREPVGVVAAIVPWNYPLMLSVKKLAPALAAGCTTILKPSEHTPLTAEKLARLVEETGFPEGVFNLVNGRGDVVGAHLAAHPGVDKIMFIGSTAVGRQVLIGAAANFKKVSLELGGKNANVVFADADLERAIQYACDAIFLTQGENCIAGGRLYIERNIYDQVLEGVVERARKIKLGPALDPDTQMGPLITGAHRRRVQRYIELGNDEGARLVCGGTSDDKSRGYFLAPTVFGETTDSMRVAKEEIFGPVLCAAPFDSEEAVMRSVNGTSYGLGAAIWTRDLSRAHRLAEQIESGQVWINTYQACDAALPFGGYKQSGWGRDTCQDSLLACTQEKTVVVDIG